jgi:putative transposase
MPISVARNREMVLRAKECSDFVVNVLNRHITIPINGKLDQMSLVRMLVGMASERQSIHSIRRSLSSVPCETSCRYHLAKLNREELEEESPLILLDSPKYVLKSGKSYKFALDYTDDPYYGEIEGENTEFVRKSQAKCSTTKFYTYVTLYVIKDGKRFTLAIFPIKKDKSKIYYIQRCLDIIFSRSLKIEVLCLDRGFYSIDVLNFLEEKKIPHIIPVVKHGKELKSLLEVQKSCFRNYTIKSKDKFKNVLLAVKVVYLKGKTGKTGTKTLGYVVFGVPWTIEKVHQVYKTRFGIESSYRIRNRVRPFTTSRNPTLRFLFTIISFLMENAWITLQWFCFAPLQRGPRKINSDQFRFDLFRILVWEGIRKCLKGVTEIPILRYPI